MKNKIIVLQGPPACGKSTKARELIKEYGSNKAVIVCRDSIRESCGDYWVPSREEYISLIEENMVTTALSYDLIPIIDGTNLNSKTIEKWKFIAKMHNADIEFIEVIESYEVALWRDADRGNKVGEKVLRGFYERYYPNLVKENKDDDLLVGGNGDETIV